MIRGVSVRPNVGRRGVMDASIAEAVRGTNFSPLDWGIVGVYLAASLLIGFLGRRYIRNMADFIGAGRAVGTRLGIATMTGTEMGLITVMYSAQKGFTGGFAAFHIALFAGLVAFLVGVTGFIVVRLRELRVLTIPEFYERRFGRRTRILGGIMLAFGGILNMGLFLKVGSMFIVGITGLSEHGWALPTVMTVLLVLVLVYTVLGGMVSVIVTDYVQFVVLSVGLLLATGMAIADLGWRPIVDVVLAEKGAAGFDPLAEGGGFGWDYVMWMAFLGLVNCALWPTAVARALAMRSVHELKRQYRWSSISFMIRHLVPYFWGICAFVFVMRHAPDLREAFFPAEEGAPALDNLYAMPIYLGRLLPAGLIGILTAAMVAAFMSTHDSYLLCWSSVIVQDVVDPLCGHRLSTPRRIFWTRTCIVLIGLYILYWGLVYHGQDDIWDYMAVTGAIYFSGAFALLVGGLYVKRASSAGAVMALCAGSMAVLGLGPVQAMLGLEEGISGAKVGLMTIASTTLAMFLGSVLFPDPPQTQTPMKGAPTS